MGDGCNGKVKRGGEGKKGQEREYGYGERIKLK